MSMSQDGMLKCSKCQPKSVKESNEPTDKSFDCKVCGKGFDKKINFERHIARIHDGKREPAL